MRRVPVAFFCSIVLAPPVSAQVRDSLSRIVAITLDNRNAFDSTDASLPARVLNFFHVTTQGPLIRRELLFHVGDRYDSARVAESERNLRALGVFKRVAIDTVHGDSGVTVNVATRDVVTLQIQPTIRNSGGSVVWGLQFVETNLLGTLSLLQAGYRHDPDRTTALFGFSRRRLINGKIGGTLELFERSDGTLAYAQLAQPYFEAASRMSGALTFDDRRDRILQFRDGNDSVASTILQNRYVRARGDFGRALYATPSGYVRVGGAVQVRRDDYVTDTIWKTSGFPTSSVTGAIGVYLEASRVQKPKVFAFQSLSLDEDVDLSTTITGSLFVAPRALGYDTAHAGVAPGIALHTGTLIPGGFAYADAFANGLYTSRGLDSGQVFLGATVVVMPGRRHQFVVHGETSALKHPLPGTEFDLGLGAGPRAFSYHAFTGDREYFLTAEYRYTVGLDVLKVVDVGLAGFVDRGGAWWAGDPHRTGTDYGIGLRLAPAHGAGTLTNRIDLAWRGLQPGRPGGWVLAVGSGFLFATGLRGASR